jgi:integrase/recombinase XerD
MTNLRQRMLEELQRRNYSPSTIRGYILAVKQFADYFGKPPDRLGATHVQRFQWYLLQERKLDPGTVEMRMSALRFFFKKMLKRRDMHFDDLPFPKTPRKLPTVLSPEEVRRMIDGTTNLMHRTLLMVLYGTGVRRTELSLLKVADIDSKRMVIHIRRGKGSRDPEFFLSGMKRGCRCNQTDPARQAATAVAEGPVERPCPDLQKSEAAPVRASFARRLSGIAGNL